MVLHVCSKTVIELVIPEVQKVSQIASILLRISPVIIANKSFRKDNEKLNNKEGVQENGRF